MANRPGTETNDLTRFDPTIGSASAEILTDWRLSSLPVYAVTPSSDGSAVAVSVRFAGRCSGTLVVGAHDGALRDPFGVTAVPDVDVSWASWSVDGRLAVLFSTTLGDGTRTVLTWDPTKDRVANLGPPCPGCIPNGRPVWSPEGRLAVTYSAARCAERDPATPDPASTSDPACDSSSIAVTDDPASSPATWRTVTPDEATIGAWGAVLGWVDEDTLLMQGGGGRQTSVVARLDIDSGHVHDVVPVSVGWVSPDLSRAVDLASADPNAPLVVTDLSTGQRTTIPLPLPDLLDLTWSPDSRRLALQAASTDGDDRGIFIVPTDGSSPPGRVLDGPYGVMGWLPEAP